MEREPSQPKMFATGEAGFPYTSKTLSTNVSRAVPRERVQSFLRQVHELGFWSIATTLKGDQTGTDGSEWIIEGVKDGKYHVVERWCANDTPPVERVTRLNSVLTSLLNWRS